MEYQKPEYTMSFDDPTGNVIKGTEARVNDLTKAVMRATNPEPVIDPVPDTYVKLPAGIFIDGEVIQDAEVQELTGEHEELLAKARNSNNAAKFISTLLQCGVVSVGNQKSTTSLLDSMLQGDLDTLIMGIRRATFGDTFEVFGVACPSCNELNDLTLDLKNIPITELEDPEVREFTVPIRKGRKVKLQFPTGSVQNEIFKKQLEIHDMNNITLTYCVLSFIEADDSERLSNGLSDIKKLGLADRKILQNYIFDKQPGPRYDKVTAACHSCEAEVPVPLNVGILFREF